ncbi:hypothetical protein ADL25_45190 [Streptomyces sp. NRRL F-5122]|uniref:hypothetical protein n=1 Tax=Streptomyces sp. NRRL F-5122 TaxID=1609098 RepID=UPI000741071B|nr:hypothetical protein [Streptomyces sp. NRRL F-5122]KUJ33491.1 hypothetical protein ADL25_45190 [Streptomyces sp. NRRL F-5122]
MQVAMALAAVLDRPLPDTVNQVRRSVIHAPEQALGLAVTTVDIIVVDTLEPSPPPATGSAKASEGEA